MTGTMIASFFLVFHLIVCILTWTGIKTGMLKAKRYLMIPVILVPPWGFFCVLFLHFQLFLGKENTRELGVEKLKVNAQLYQNNFQMREESDQEIVPLEEALLINDPELRRQLIMNILNDDPSQYMEVLEQARMNEDVEVVHYAITAMVELSKEYDNRLQKLERKYAGNSDDPKILDEYCDFMEEYLQQGILEKQIEQMQRNQYAQLLEKQFKRKKTLHICVSLVENYMKLREYNEAGRILRFMDENWHRSEEYWVHRIFWLAEQRMGKELQKSLNQMKEEHIYLSSESKEALALWVDW
nr:hypothetical protein [uncultured Blautia sp.]